jgi:high-affinity Fe2+/Pb2+ permease
MILFARNKEPERYYLFAGMGGKPAKRKELFFLTWSLAAGLVVSIVLGIVLYWLSLRR